MNRERAFLKHPESRADYQHVHWATAVVRHFMDDLFYHDRGDDELLPLGVVESLLESGEITVGELVAHFEYGLCETLRTQIGKKAASRNRVEVSLLLYLEDCEVNKCGIIQDRHLNEDDDALLELWNESGYVTQGYTTEEERWIEMSPLALQDASFERRQRVMRMRLNRGWEKEE